MTPMFWQHYLGSIIPAISAFIENPFVLSCALVDNLRRDRERPEEIRPPARVTRIAQSAMFYNMKEKEAKQVLEKEGYAYRETIAVSPDSIPELLKKVWGAGEMKKGAEVDLITNKQTGKVIFAIPVAEQPSDVQEKTKKDTEKKGKQKDT